MTPGGSWSISGGIIDVGVTDMERARVVRPGGGAAGGLYRSPGGDMMAPLPPGYVIGGV